MFFFLFPLTPSSSSPPTRTNSHAEKDEMIGRCVEPYEYSSEMVMYDYYTLKRINAYLDISAKN